MYCPRCGTRFDGIFCPTCGTRPEALATPGVPPVLCRRCGVGFFGRFCPNCGLPAAEAPPGPPRRRALTWRSLGSLVWTTALLAFFAVVVIDLIALFVSLPGIVDGILLARPECGTNGAVVCPGIFYLIVPSPFALGFVDFLLLGFLRGPLFLGWFLLMVAVILGVHAFFAVREGRGVLRLVVSPLHRLRARLASTNAWVVVGQVFFATFSVQILYVLILQGVGVQTPTPEQQAPDWYLLYNLAFASVWEEFVTRFLYIGVPLFLYVLLRSVARGKGMPSPGRYLFGGDVPLTRLAASLVVLSALLFGLAHVPGWDWWKVFPAFVAGLGLGYLFLRKGILASIFMHFANNYFVSASLLSESNFAVSALLGILLLAIVLLGFLFFLWYILASWNFLVGGRGGGRGVPRPAPASPPPSRARIAPPSAPPPRRRGFFGYGVPPMQFVCDRCGWTEARFSEGKFYCTRCGGEG
jgi:membrane protease YdiL (CAAX protease family)